MDRLDNFRRVIGRILERHAQLPPSHGQIEAFAICDANKDHYLLMDVGWGQQGRVHSIVFHVRIRNGKIWVEWDGTEDGIVQELLDAGILKEDIVLAFYRPEKRPLTEFAVA